MINRLGSSDGGLGTAERDYLFGDLGDTVGIFRAAEARFHLRFTNSAGDADIDFLFGESTFLPIVGDF